MRINEDVLRYLTVRVDELEEGPSVMMQSRGERRRGDRGDDRDGDVADAAARVLRTTTAVPIRTTRTTATIPTTLKEVKNEPRRADWNRWPAFGRRRWTPPLRRRRKTCPFSGRNAPKIDYKDVKLLQRYVSERGKMVPSRITAVSPRSSGNCPGPSSVARYLGLLPYIIK